MEKYPKYVFSSDGFIGCFAYLDFGEFPVYRFPGGCRTVDNVELKRGCNTYEEAKAACKEYCRSHKAM